MQYHCVLLEINGERLTTCIVYVDKWVCLTLVHTYVLVLKAYEFIDDDKDHEKMNEK